MLSAWNSATRWSMYCFLHCNSCNLSCSTRCSDARSSSLSPRICASCKAWLISLNVSIVYKSFLIYDMGYTNHIIFKWFPFIFLPTRWLCSLFSPVNFILNIGLFCKRSMYFYALSIILWITYKHRKTKYLGYSIIIISW